MNVDTPDPTDMNSRFNKRPVSTDSGFDLRECDQVGRGGRAGVSLIETEMRIRNLLWWLMYGQREKANERKLVSETDQKSNECDSDRQTVRGGEICRCPCGGAYGLGFSGFLSAFHPNRHDRDS